MRVEGVKFAIVPEWVIDRLIDNPRALAVYTRLARWSNDNGEVRRSEDELAAKCGVTVRTVIRCLNHLQTVGAVEVTAQFDRYGNQAWNLYTLYPQPQDVVSDSGPQHVGGGDIPDTNPVTDVTPITKPPNETYLTSESEVAPRTEKQQKHDRMANALVAAMGWNREEVTEPEWGRTHAAAKHLTQIGADPRQVAGRAERYPEVFGGCTMTPTAISTNWAALAGEGWRDLIGEET